MPHALRIGLVMLLFWMPANTGVIHAAEYIVSCLGHDSHDGLSAQTALATIQKGLDLLKPGDTLTIEPGEYEQSAWRQGLGGEARTTIRARVPGTVLIRGDEPVGPWRKVEGHRSIYATVMSKPVHAVNEVDTLTVLRNVPAVSELEAGPGRFHYDAESQTLYIIASDWKEPSEHSYTASVRNTDGLFLGGAKNVVISGLAFTGFHNTRISTAVPSYRNRYSGNQAVWGIFLLDSESCEIIRCTAYLNGGGIGVEYLEEPKVKVAGTRIEQCVAYGNFSQISPYQSSGIGVYAPNGDIVRGGLAYLNQVFGVRFYQKAHAPGLIDQTRAWGNTIDEVSQDLHVKVGGVMPVTRSISAGGFKLHGSAHCVLPLPPEESTDGSWTNSNNIILQPETGPAVRVEREFADPANGDYRLQSSSQFRNIDGTDAGPAAYVPNVYYVALSGDDRADGMSMNTAWKSLARAGQALKPGDTLYLDAGAYAGDWEIKTVGTADNPIAIRGRGTGEVALLRPLHLKGAAHVSFQRLTFTTGVSARECKALDFEQCRFLAASRLLDLQRCAGVTIRHCDMVDWSEAAIFATGTTDLTIHGNRMITVSSRPAVRVDSLSDVTYSDYNAYAHQFAWHLGQVPASIGILRPRLDAHSLLIDADPRAPGSAEILQQARQRLATGGGLGKPIGTYRDQERRRSLELVGKLAPHVVSATTANVEWITSLPARCELAWGPTPECANVITLDVNHLGNLGITGLSPGRTYYFQLRRVTELTADGGVVAANSLVPASAPITLTTLREDAAAKTYYVSTQGNDSASGEDHGRAFRTLGKAASVVNVGDTVLVASGRYTERVRMRATGSAEKPITFRAAPGGKVVMDGAGKLLGNSFVISGVGHLRFDGFYFEQTNMNPESGLMVGRAANFNIFQSRDIEISRCFADGRGGYAAKFVIAGSSQDVVIRNSVNVEMMGCAIYANRTPELLVEHCVFATPKIASFVIDNTASQIATFRNNVFTDMLEKKSIVNSPGSEIEDMAALKMRNNAFFFRSFPPQTRVMFAEVDHARRMIRSRLTVAEFDARLGTSESIFADPQFAGVEALLARGVKPMPFAPEMLTADPATPLDFNSYFVTNPKLTERRIGLQPEAFADFDFSRSTPPISSVTSPVK